MNDARTLRRWLILIILACAALYLVGNGRVPLWDRDEGWYAQCSQQMWQTGDWVVPRYLDQLRTEKPVLVYWLQLAGYALFGGPSELAVRFYASVAQTIVLCIIAFGFTRLADSFRATWTTFIYGTCAMAIISAKMCLTDATLMVFVSSAMLCLMRWYLKGFTWPTFLLFSLAMGLGGLTKGPIVFVPPAATLLVLAILDFRAWWQRMNAKNIARCAAGGLLCVVISLAVCAPWLIALHRREPAWIMGALGAVDAHLTQSTFGHSGPVGYYLALVWATFFPWSLVIPFAVYVAWRHRAEKPTRFAIAAIVGPWIFFELMRTKLPHYTLVTYPFLAFLVADAIARTARHEYRALLSRPVVMAVGIWAILVGAVASVPWIALLAQPELKPLPYLPMAIVSLVGFACTIGTWWFFYRRRPIFALSYMGGSFVLLIAVFYGWLLPQLHFLHTSPRVAEILKRHGGDADGAPVGEVVTLVYSGKGMGYEEPTLMFYQGGTIRPLKQDKYLQATDPGNWPRLMVITDMLWNSLPGEIHGKLEVLGTVRGYLYSGSGRVQDVMVVRPAGSGN